MTNGSPMSMSSPKFSVAVRYVSGNGREMGTVFACALDGPGR
jgi:hypothetical protein